MISIIIPIYNRNHLIKKCLDSIYSQGISDFEVIIIDDGSTEPIDGIRKNLKVYRQEHQGAAAAKNLGYKVSKGEYLIFVDSDVILEPQCLKKMLSKLKDSGPLIAFCYSDFLINEKGKTWKYPVKPFNFSQLKKANFVLQTSLIKKTSLSILKGPFDNKMKRLIDWDLWLRLALIGLQGEYIPETLVTHYVQKDSISNNHSFSYWENFLRRKLNL